MTATLQVIQQSDGRAFNHSITADVLYIMIATIQVIQQSDGRGCYQSITADVL